MSPKMYKVIPFILLIIATIEATNIENDSTTVAEDIEITQNPEERDGEYVTIIDEPSIIVNDSRVIGGVAVKQIVPYQVSLQTYRRNRWRHFCGGSIISPHHVLTAAHCVDKVKAEEIHVVAGTLTWSTGGDRHRTVSKRQHPQFSMSPKIINDLAILKVSPPFNLHKSSVGTIGLGGSTRLGEKVKVQLTGWGATTPTAAGGLPNNLQQLNYETISNDECSRKGFKVTSKEICALESKGRGACMGDSGGPLVTTQSPTYLVGVVSYGTAKCAQGTPDVYTRVSSFVPYINKVVSSEIP